VIGRRSAGCGAITLVLVLAMVSVASGVPATWSPRISIAPHALDAVSCPSPSLCLAVGSGGEGASSTNPAGGMGAWSSADIDGTHRLISLSCPTPGFCAATDNASRVVTSDAPTGGPSHWSAHTIDAGRWITSISCASSHLCVAVDRHGGILTSTHPTDLHRAWSRFNVRHTSFVSVSCPSTKLCVATNNSRGVLVSTKPTGGSRSWHAHTVLPSQTVLLGVSCATAHACMLVNYENGTEVAFRPSTHPTAAGIWRPDGDVIGYSHEGTARGAVSCVNVSFCAGITHSDFSFGDGWVTTDFGHHWQHVALNDSPSDDHLLSAIACGGTSLCVAVDNGGGAIVGS
jgi:hypothetical protein